MTYRDVLRCELARRDFLEYCKLFAPDFYKEDRKFLMEAMTMDEYTEQDIFRSAIETYGAVMQITVAFEEMSELQKELCKHLRGSGSKENIAEEIADVEIMIEQMKMIFNCETAVLQVREKKVKRLKERIEQNG